MDQKGATVFSFSPSMINYPTKNFLPEMESFAQTVFVCYLCLKVEVTSWGLRMAKAESMARSQCH